MPKQARAKKDGGMRTNQVVTKRQVSVSDSQVVVAKKRAATKVKYVAGPANNVYSFG